MMTAAFPGFVYQSVLTLATAFPVSFAVTICMTHRARYFLQEIFPSAMENLRFLKRSRE